MSDPSIVEAIYAEHGLDPAADPVAAADLLDRYRRQIARHLRHTAPEIYAQEFVWNQSRKRSIEMQSVIQEAANEPCLEAIKTLVQGKSLREIQVIRGEVAHMVAGLEGLSRTITAQNGQDQVREQIGKLQRNRRELVFLDELIKDLSPP